MLAVPAAYVLVTGLQITSCVAAIIWQENVFTSGILLCPALLRASDLLVAYTPSMTPATLLLATCQLPAGSPQ